MKFKFIGLDPCSIGILDRHEKGYLRPRGNV